MSWLYEFQREGKEKIASAIALTAKYSP
jgi:hypothetical protein